MMKKLIIAFCFLIASNSLFGQNYNLGFEEWDSSMPAGTNNNFPNSCTMPLNASATNSEYFLNQWTVIPFGVCRTTDAHSGNYAAVVFMWYNGSTGSLSFGQGCDNPNTAGKEICKYHFPSKLYGISGYYKYLVDSFEPNDTYNKKATAHIKTYKVGATPGTLELLSHDSLIYQQADSYQPFQLIVQYSDSSIVPDSVSIWFESQGYGSGTTSCGYAHFLYLDDLEFHFSPMSSTSVKNSFFKQKIKISPNPAKNTLKLQYNNLHIQSLKLTDLSGRVIKTFPAESKSLDVSGVGAGLYFLQVKAKEGEVAEKVEIR